MLESLIDSKLVARNGRELLVRNLDFVGMKSGWENECPLVDEEEIIDSEDLQQNFEILLEHLRKDKQDETTDVSSVLSKLVNEEGKRLM